MRVTIAGPSARRRLTMRAFYGVSPRIWPRALALECASTCGAARTRRAMSACPRRPPVVARRHRPRARARRRHRARTARTWRSTGSPRAASRRWSRSIRGVRRVIPFALRRWRRQPLAAATWREMARFRRDLRARALRGGPRPAGAGERRADRALARGARHGPIAPACASRSPRSRTTRTIAIVRNQHFVERCRQLAAAALGYRVEGPPRWPRARRAGASGAMPGAAVRRLLPRDEPRRQALAGSALARADRRTSRARASRCCCRGAAHEERARSERLAAGDRERDRAAVAVAARARHAPRARGARRRRRHGPHASRRSARHADDRALLRHRPRRSPASQRAVRTRATSAASGTMPSVDDVVDARASSCAQRRAADAPPMRALYTLLWWLALPLLPLRLWWRGRREPGYRERIGERFGLYRAPIARRASGDLDARGVARRNARRGAADRAAAPRASRGDAAAHAHDGDRPRGGPRAVRRSRRAGMASVRRAVRGARVPRAFQAARRAAHGNRAVAEPRRAARAARRAAVPRQRAPVRAVRGRLCAHSPRCRARCWPSLAGVAAQTEADAARLPRSARRRRASPATSSSTSTSPTPRARSAARCASASARRGRCGSPRRRATAKRR